MEMGKEKKVEENRTLDHVACVRVVCGWSLSPGASDLRGLGPHSTSWERGSSPHEPRDAAQETVDRVSARAPPPVCVRRTARGRGKAARPLVGSIF